MREARHKGRVPHTSSFIPHTFLPPLGPIEVFVQELEGALAIDRVRAIEEFDLGEIAEAELVVETAHAGKFMRDPFVNGPHTINGQGTFKFLHQHLQWPEPK